MKLYLLVIAVLLTFAACQQVPEMDTGMDDGMDGQQDTESPAGDMGDVDNGEGMTDEESEALAEELREIFSRRTSSEYMVEWNLTTESGNETQSMVMTQYVQGAENMRSDAMIEGLETRTYLTGDNFTSCFNMQEWQCQQMAYEESMYDMIAGDIIEEDNITGYDITRIGSRTIAGVTAECYLVDVYLEDVHDGMVEYCFSPEGVPLYIKSEEEGDITEMIALSYATSVDDNAFELPAEPQSINMPELPEGYEDMMNMTS